MEVERARVEMKGMMKMTCKGFFLLVSFFIYSFWYRSPVPHSCLGMYIGSNPSSAHPLVSDSFGGSIHVNLYLYVLWL